MTLTTTIDRLFAQYNRPDSPGAAVGVTRHGKLIHEACYGMADLAHAIPIDRHSLIRIGSQSKQFTVLLALLLEAEGKLDMNAEVHTYLPWLPKYPHPITLWHLATNTSGMRDFLEMMVWNGLPLHASSDRQLARDIIANYPEVNYVPGSQMLYSNTGFFLLSEIVEQVSGRTFNELLRARITSRANMPDTLLIPRDAEIHPRLVAMHQQGPTGWETVRWGFPLGGEGGMASTLIDMLAWQSTLAAPPADWAPHLARMTAPLHYTNGTETLYRAGLVVDRYRGALGIGHGGGVAGGKSESIRFPDHGLGIVILGNLAEMNPFALARRIADAALDLPPPPPPEAAAALCAAPGLYREPATGEVFALSARNHAPLFTTSGGATSLDEIAPNRFAPERPTQHLEFTLTPTGTITATFCGAPTTYHRITPPAAPPRDLSGPYANRALGLDVTIDGPSMLIRTNIGALRTRLSWADTDLLLVHPANPTDPRAFIGTLLLTPSGLTLTTDRTKSLTFAPA